MTGLLVWLALTALAGPGDGQIVGVVFTSDGRPVSGATVEAGPVTVATDADGVWRVTLPPGDVAVRIVAGGEPAVFPVVPVAAASTTELLVSLGPGAPTYTLEAPSGSQAVADVPTGPPGQLTGRLVERDGGAPIAGVRLFFRGATTEAVTDADGQFSVELPSGTWDVSTIRAGYDGETLAVEVVAGETRSLDLPLARSGLVLAAMTVRAPRIAGGTASVLDERQDASTVSDVLGAEQMSRAGDSDAASALRRVTGLTVIGGKYVYVRGLGDRYSATVLDGSSLPSPEPEKRVVPLDLFPTSLLEAVVIQKTFSPDRPAEFGGGLVEVRTRAIPEDPVLQLGLTGAWAGGTTGRTANFGDTGPTDWLGLGRAHRALPPELARASANSAIKPSGIFSEDGYTADELESFGEMLANRWGIDPRKLPPDFGASVTGGGKVDVGPVSLGGLTGGVFSNGWSIDEGFRSVYSQGASGLEEKKHTTFEEVQNRVRAGGALALGAEVEDVASITSTTLLMRSSTGTALRYVADDPTGSDDSRSTRVDWEEQQLLFERLAATVDTGPVVVDARYAFAAARRDQPDRREYVQEPTEGGYALSQRASWNEVFTTDLVDRSREIGLDLRVPIREQGRVQVGGLALRRERTSTTRRFTYNFQGSEGIDLYAPMEDVIVPENIGEEGDDDPGYLELEENTVNSDDYSAAQRLDAAYGLLDVPWHPRFSTLVGARFERSVQTVTTFELFDTSQTPIAGELASSDVLPAATVTLGVGRDETPDQMLIRAGYGRTLSRPEFRELSEVAFYDYRSGRLLFGNPDLARATIDNVDLRWEWYPRPGESLSAGLFGKRFVDPIESVIAVSAVSGSVGTFENAASASNLGAEIDLRRRLFDDVWFTANGSWIASRVDLSGSGGNQTSSERPLQGQSPWVLNAQLSYENPDLRRNAALLYNAFGPRIVEVGTSGIPDTYELPVHRVDLVASQGFGPHWAARIRGTNLLDWPSRQRTGDKIAEETRSGVGLALTLTWTPL